MPGITVPTQAVFDQFRTQFRIGDAYSSAVADQAAAIDTLLEALAEGRGVELALSEFIDSFADYDPSPEMGAGFTCGEMPVLVELLEALDAHEVAEAWWNAHVQAEKPGDMHYPGPDEEPA